MEPTVTNRLPLTILVDRVDQRTIEFVNAAVDHAAKIRDDPERRVLLPAMAGMVLRGVLTELMSELGPQIMARKEAIEQRRSLDNDIEFAIGAYFAIENIRTIIDHMIE